LQKEKDLELAARIGQQLLEQNQQLGEKVAALEQENKEVIENLTQLKHELNFKTQLLELYNDTESAETSKAGILIVIGQFRGIHVQSSNSIFIYETTLYFY